MVSAVPGNTAATIVFIDTSVPGYQQITASVPAGDTVVLIDGSQDGIAQISSYLSKTSNVGAIHIVSHGADGELDLGTSSVTGDTLGQYAGQIASWKTALAPGADIMLYGCSIASDGAGQQFVDSLAGLTGATVAASSDNTGAAASGGNWNLEFSTSKVTASTLNDPVYDGLLSHFRASSLTWTPLTGNTVQFAMQVSYRESAWTANGGLTGLYKDVNGNVLTSAPVVGQIISVTTGQLKFGDNLSVPYYIKVTAISTSQDYFVGNMVDKSGNAITHTYPSSGTFTASYEDSARLSTLQNFADDSFRSQTVVDPGAGNSPPVSSLPPIVQVAAGKKGTFQIPAIDPNGDTLVYSVGTASQFISNQASILNGDKLTSSTPIAPSFVSLSSSGLLTYDLTKFAPSTAGQQWVMTVNIADVDSKGNVKSTTPLDFLLQVVDTRSNTPPVFTIVPPAQTVIAGIAATEVELLASDPQASPLTVQALNPIAGMTTVYHADEGELHVDITPTAGEIGTSSIVNFQAIDALGLATQTSVTYTVISPAPAVKAANQTLEAGQSAVIGTATAARAGDTLSLSATGAVKGTLSLVPTTSGGSTYNVVYTAKSGASLSGSDKVTYTVTDTTLASQIVAGSGVSASTTATASVTLDPGAAIAPLTPSVVQQGGTTAVGTVTPGLAGDTLTLTQASGAQGTLALGAADPATGIRQVIYTPPATIAASTIDAVSYTITDQLGGTVQGSSNVKIDAGPTLTFDRIAGDGVVNAKDAAAGVVLSGTTTNVADGQAVTLQILDSGGKLIDTVSTSVVSNAYAVGYPKADLIDGKYRVVASVTDQFDISATSISQPLTIDTVTTESAIADAAVAAGSDGKPYVNASRFNGGTTTLTGTAEAGDTVSVSVNGAAAQSATVGADGTWSYQLAGLTDGQSYTATATATDAAGNQAVSAPFAFAVDTMITTPTVLAAPYANKTTEATLAITVADGDTDLASTAVSVTDGTGTVVATRSAAGQWVADVSGLMQGQLTAIATATDTAGNVAIGTTTLLHDDRIATPAITAAPYANAATEKAVAITVADGDTDLASTAVSVTDGTGTVVATRNAAGQWVADVSGLMQGQLTATATATDTAGNVATGSTTLVHDDQIATPAVSAAPYASKTTEATFAITVADGDTDLASTAVSVTDGTGTVVATRNAAGQWVADVSGLKQGQLTATATATDTAGNVATDSTTLVHDDQIATPAVSAAPYANKTTEATFAITVADSDTDLVSMAVSVTDGTGTMVATRNAAGQWVADVSGLKQGHITAIATATDTAGNVATGSTALVHDDQITTPAVSAAPYANKTTEATFAITVADSDTDLASTAVSVTDGTGTVVATRNAAGQWVADVSGLKQGQLTATATATDKAGNVAIGTTTLLHDDRIAIPAITAAPYANAATEKAFAITVADSDTDLASTAVTVSDGTSKVTATQTAAGQWVADVSGLAQGQLTATATATDKAGNVAIGTTTLLHDDRIATPAVTAAPYANAATEKAFAITVADSDTDLASTAVTVSDGTSKVTATQTAAGQWVADVSGLMQGQLTAIATATDTAGNVAIGTTTLLHDDRIATPAVTAAPYANAATEKAFAITVADSDTDLASTAVTVSDGTSKVTATQTAAGQWVADVSGLAQGQLTATATATDKAGNVAIGTTTLVHDDQIATPTVSAAPYANKTTEATFAITVADGDTDLASTAVSVTDGTGTVVATRNAAGQWVADVSGLMQGQLTVTATATDTAGNVATGSTTLVHDDQIATPTVSATPYANKTTEATFAITVADGDTDLASTAVSVTDGTGTVVATRNAAGQWVADVSGLKQGQLTAIATATDTAGNVATGSTTLVHDDQIATPAVSAAPYANKTTEATFAITVADGDTDLASTAVSVTDGTGTVVATRNAAGQWVADVSGLKQGQLTAIATATDMAGNVATGSTALVHDDQITTPTVSFAPTNSAAGAVDVDAGHATAAGFAVSGIDADASATVIFSGVSKATGQTAAVTVAATAGTVDLSGFVDGTVSATATASDKAGNTATSKAVTTLLDTTLSTPTIAFAATNSAAGAADVNAAHATMAGYTVGSIDADATATVTFSGTLKSTGASGTVAGDGTNGTHTVDLSGFEDGTVTASISDQDSAGNMRMGQSATTLDTTSPVVTITAPVAGDNTVNAAEAAQGFAVSGTTTAENGQNVTVQIRNAGGATVDTYAIVAAGGNYRAAVTAAQAQGLTDGSYTAVAYVSDLAGNPAAKATQAFTVDETAPAAPSMALTDDTGLSSTDKVTSDPALTVTPAESGGTLLYSIDGGATYTTTAPAFATDGSADGQHTVDVEQRDAAGNTSVPGSFTFTLDTTPPTITAVAETGNGIGVNGNGDVPAGTVVTFTVQTDGPVSVTPASDGSTPTLVFNNGGVAAYTGQTGAAVNELTFSYTVQKGQDTTALQLANVTGSADVTDQAGNVIDLGTLATASLPSGTLIVDTTPPVALSVTDTAAQNSGPTPIGIAAPSDNLTAAGGLAIVAGSLPTDGTVTLANGTPVTSGQALTAAQLAGLQFTPTPGVSGQGSTFTYTLTDGAGNATQGTAALNVGAAGTPTITGTHGTTTMAEAPVAPFAGVTVTDPSSAAGATETLTIVITGAGGALSEGPGYMGPRTLSGGGSTYQLTGTVADVKAELDALSFTPTAGAPGTTSKTTFVLTNRSTSGTSVTDAGTSITDVASAIVTGSRTPQAVTPDRISISQQVSFHKGVFTLAGQVSSATGVSSVEISAVLNDGTRQDLGAATLNGNGTFTFADTIGANQQGFFEATLTDGAGVQTVSADPGFSLMGGLGQGPFRACQTTYSADGSTVASTSLFRADDSRKVDVSTGGQTLNSDFFDTFDNHGAPSNTFVFDPGHGLDIVNQFRVGGADHDTLSFKGSDFGNDIATVLQSTYNAHGGVVILDPISGDTVKLAGLTKAELRANQSDFTFHA